MKKGESAQSLSVVYGVGKSTISDIKKQSSAILTSASKLDCDAGCSKRKTMKRSANECLDEALFTWFSQKRSSGQPINGPLVCEKALDFNKKLGGDPKFSASQGWLDKFKSRHGIRQLDIQGEKLSADSSSASGFVTRFSEILREDGYDLELVYNADESGLCWKSLPSKTPASKREVSAPGYKSSKDRVTVMVCANATGSHRIPMLFIGKSKNPRGFKNAKIPLVYKNQSRAWMDRKIFVDWYDNTFIPEVKKFLEQVGKQSKPVLLVLDNAPSHPDAESLTRDGFKVIYLPPNVTSILQPMDQSVIETMKRNYRKQLLRRLLLKDNDDEKEKADSVIAFFKSINLKDCCYMIVEAWNLVSPSTLKKAWNKLLKKYYDDLNEPTVDLLPLNERHEETELVTEMLDTLESLKVREDCDEEDVLKWLNSDADDQGFPIVTDEEIIESVLSDPIVDDEEESVDDCALERPTGPSHDEALKAVDVVFQWLERQEEVEIVQLLQLQKIKELALTKKNKQDEADEDW
ncbi:unnamed protein product [Acanthoscelides obtectus]|uniref:HTH CENPB-type domain-containing protein n=1 Tax=Acanthoscelides obtectus TaxID=200917 RepID=A0A9P0K5P6_ACAOB|nr:unnamed protein product [Acanthoscelides obtectus]CAK1676706.1 Jerky protein homolog-like [Acanthoscelides obtectus]